MHALTLYFESEEQLEQFIETMRDMNISLDLNSVSNAQEEQDIDLASILGPGYIKV